MEPLITFIIPSIARLTLMRTVESLKNQTNPNWRSIVIYDGVDGPDFNDERITIIKSPKTGLEGPRNGQSGLVRNIGIKLSKTPWIGFLDDDDTIHPDYVERLNDSYNDKDFIVWRMKYENGIILPPIGEDTINFSRVGISFCYKMALGNILFDKNRDGEDFDFLMKLKNLTNNWVITPEVYYNVRH
jgi:glycosyltransferase involved in cell wall biosynthesis